MNSEDYAIFVDYLIILPVELSDGRSVRAALFVQDITELMGGRLGLRRNTVKNLEAPMPRLPNCFSLRNSGACEFIVSVEATMTRKKSRTCRVWRRARRSRGET